MGYRKSDCQFHCRREAQECAYDATIPEGGMFQTASWSDFDDYTPAPGDAQWDDYARCMDICNEIGLYDDSAFTTPWPPEGHE